jgi:hypothetical protein
VRSTSGEGQSPDILRLDFYGTSDLTCHYPAGLSIPEVGSGNGDAGYLLNNMISKYTLAASYYRISKEALKQFVSLQVDLEKTYTRRRFYGKRQDKNPFIYEHMVPAVVVRDQLLNGKRSVRAIRNVLEMAGEVTVLLRRYCQVNLQLWADVTQSLFDGLKFRRELPLWQHLGSGK